MKVEEQNIILYDGVCKLCSRTIQFIVKRDKKRVFRYASLQSTTGRRIIANRNIDDIKVDSLLLIDSENSYSYKSTAVLKIIKRLPGIYSLFSVLLIFPRFFRDRIYDIIAKNRYKWFGKNDSCIVPSSELRTLFID